MFKLFEKRPVIHLWIVAYSIMLTTPIIANLCVFNSIHSQLKYEMHTRNQYFLKNMSNTYDGIFSDVNRISMEIQRDEYISSIAKMESLSNETRYIAASAANNLNLRKNSSQYIIDIFVYFPKLDFIITSDSIFESYEFFKSRITESDKSYEEWKENLNSSRNKSIFNEHIIRSNGETEEAVGFIEPIKKMREITTDI